MKSKVLPLESLRGIAALTVALFHFESSSFLSDNLFVQHAYLLVELFFVLSGYVIAMNYFDRVRTSTDLFTFQAKRFWRLYPLHLVTLVAFVGIECIKYGFEKYSGISASYPAFSGNNWYAFLHNCTLTQAIFLTEFTFNAPSWSISTEFYTYLVFGLIMLTGRIRVVLLPLVMVSSLIVLLAEQAGRVGDTVSLSIVRCFYSFFLGVIVFRLFHGKTLKASGLLAFMSIIGSVICVCFLARTQYQLFVPLMFACMVVLVSNTSTDSHVVRLLSVKPLVFLGTISYSIYMVHSGIWWVVTQILRFIVGVSTYVDEKGVTRIDLDPWSATIVTCLGLFVVLSVSVITYHLIEDRFRRGWHSAWHRVSRTEMPRVDQHDAGFSREEGAG